MRRRKEALPTYVFLLFVHVTNLEPDVLLVEWSGRVGDDVLEALEKMSMQEMAQGCDGHTSRLCWNFCCCL